MSLYVNLSNSLSHPLCPFQLLLDLAFQTENRNINPLAFAGFGELNSANDWINLESLGNIVPLRAQELISQLLNTLPKTLSIHIHLDDQKLTSDNIYSLLLLAEALPQVSLFFYHEHNTNDDREQLIQLFAKKGTVDIHFAKSDTHSTSAQKQLKQLRVNRENILESMGFKFSLPLNTNLLIGYAWTLLKSGAYDVGTTLLEEALLSVENLKHKDMLLLHLQIIRFHSHQYLKLALEHYPPVFSGIDDASVNYLYYLKAYAATLTQHLDIAETYFERACINEDLVLTDEFSLYQLNIFALYNVFRQKTDVAYQLEKKIEQFTKSRDIDSIGLNYVNFINIARLHKKAKEFNLSLAYYEKAYKVISQGGYTTSDHIYYNMNLGSLHEASGDFLKALSYWVNAALHWLVAENPYALAWRPKLILCHEKTAELNSPLLLNDVTQFFCAKIDNLLIQTAIKKPEITEHHFNFCLNHPSLQKEACYIHHGLMFYSSHQASKPLFKELKPLAQYLSAFINQWLSLNADDITLAIDDLIYNAFDVDRAQARMLAKVNRCHNCYWNGELLAFNEMTINELQSGLKLSLSELIENAEKEGNALKLKYKRSFLNKTLHDQDEIKVFLALKNGENLAVSEQLVTNVPLLQQLLYKKIICLQINNNENQVC